MSTIMSINDELFTTASKSFYELDTKVNEDGYTYGVVHIVTPEVKLIDKPLAIVFTVDKSGSMAETDSRGQTKMAYVKHTLKNIFRYFVLRQEEYNNFHVNVNIIGFDDNITQITKGQFIACNAENILKLMDLVDSLSPNGMTNIELALKTAKCAMETYMQEPHVSKDTKLIHMLLTDGDTNVGSCDPNILANVGCLSHVKNCFIGMGSKHNGQLLSKLSKHIQCGNHSFYRFIDKFENAGKVYGEILHNLLYLCLENAKLKIQPKTTDSTTLYDFQTNQWVDSLDLSLSGGVEKLYHFRQDCRETIDSPTYLLLQNTLEQSGSVEIHKQTMNTTDGLDMLCYQFRLSTLQILYKCTVFHEAKYSHDKIDEDTLDLSINNIQPTFTPYTTTTVSTTLLFPPQPPTDHYNCHVFQRNTLKKELTLLFEDMKQIYFTCILPEHDNKKNFLKVLLDDVMVSRKALSMNGGNGFLYSCSRHNSQGSQQGYLCSPDFKVESQRNKAKRGFSDSDSDDDSKEYKFIDTASTYLTRDITQTMDYISVGVDK